MLSLYVHSHGLEKRLLASSYPFVRLSVGLSAFISADATGRISVKFDNGHLYENLLRKSKVG